MIKNLKNNSFFLILSFSVLIIHQFIFQQFFPNFKGLVGHDYQQFIPNFIFGKIWFQNNFLSVPWFSPSFCCGIPFFADPQSMYYSIPQIIFLIFNPILSLKIIFFILSGFSYVGMFLLVKKNFKFNHYTSLLCASLFLFNGFFVYRAIAGHAAYLSYIFIPLYCFFLIQSLEDKLNKSGYIYLVLSAIVFANFFHSGSGPIILIIFISILSVLLLYAHVANSFTVFFKFALSLILGTLISLSKITASLFFLSNFPRHYPATEFNSFASFIKTFFLSLFFNPNQKHFNDSVESMFPFGVHEMDYSVSLVPIILFFFFLVDRKSLKLNYYNIRFLFFLLIVFLIPILLNVNFLNQFQIIAKIPILNSTWVQFRWMLIYILPIIIISGLIVENLKINFQQKKYLVVILVSILLIQNLIKDNSWHFEDQRYSIKNVMDFSIKLKQKINPEIIGPAILLDKSGSPKKVNNKNDMFFFSYSPLLCYQPIFGYGLEKLNTKQITFNSKQSHQDDSLMYYSNKFEERDGHFMFFNPSCFLYPKENNCLPGDTFKISEQEQLIQFANYQKFKFKQNKIQIFSNYVSIFTFLLSLLYLIYRLTIFIFSFKKKY